MSDSQQTGSRPFTIAVMMIGVAITLSVQTTASEPSSPAVLQPVPLSEEANSFVRGIILLLMPSEYVDDDDWGSQRRIQSGLNVKLDGVKLHTSRRWKEVNHGLWKRTELRLHQPEEKFQIRVDSVPQDDETISRYRLHATARVRIHGRQQQWSNGVKLYSVSGYATADVTLKTEVSLHRTFVDAEGSKRLRILPHIESLAFIVNGFRLERLGHAKGAVIREFGRSLRSAINRAISSKSPKMIKKVNQKIQKKPDRFELPLGVFSLLVGPAEAGNPAEESSGFRIDQR